jgi:aspartyl-tRNA(Asn)/glutamyl-tRNA(Gln) amidotransferase subunit A
VIAQLGAATAARGLADGTLAPLDVLGEALRAIDRLDHDLHAFITVDREGAHRQAAASQRRQAAGSRLGPLDGVVVAVKDVIDVAGLPTTAGAGAWFHREIVPVADAEAVRRLRHQGAVLIGKTHTHEFALGGTGENPHHGDARNPWNPTRITGGSSSGSAIAAATGMAHAALGTDAGGSVRGPAALCGVVGLKPSHGLVPLTGCIPSGWSLDHVGTLTPAVADATLLLEAITGRSLTYAQARHARFGVPRHYFFDHLATDVDRVVNATLERLRGFGYELQSVDWPDAALARTADAVSWTINSAEAAAFHEPWISVRPERYGDDIRARLELGRGLLASEYLRAQRVRTLLARELIRVFDEIDVIVTPACPVTAFPHGTETVDLGGAELPVAALNRTFRIANLTGWPAVSIPCGSGDDGLPVAVQLLAAHGDDARLLAVAADVEAMLHDDTGG